MAARKLQTEIDRTLKKVAEGVELFESIYDKMQASTNQTQKEKLELDLKTQIKKLQRMRDLIKQWVAGNEIKDKSQLLDNRRLIETQMEKFKACEKEMKTKAYSKAGLIQAAILDPKELEKEETAAWLRGQVEELQMQVEQAEAEIEAMQGAGKKRNKSTSAAAGRQEELEHLNDRRKWHISRLEIVLRLLDNGSMSTDRVIDLKEDVQYFVESNTGEDFDEDEGIYDELNLDEEEAKFGPPPDDHDSDESDIASEDLPPRTPKRHDEESVASSKRDDSPIMKKAVVQMRKPSVDNTAKPPPNLTFAQQPMASILKASLATVVPPRPTPTTLPQRYATAAAPRAAPVQAATTPASGTQPIPPSQSDDAISTSPSLTHPSVTSPMLSSASVSLQPDGSFYSGQESPALSEAVSSGPAATSSPQRVASRKASIASSQSPSAVQMLASSEASGPTTLPQQVQQYTQGAATTESTAPLPEAQPQFPPGVKLVQDKLAAPSSQATIGAQRPISNAAAQRPGGFPGSLQDLVDSFESVKQQAASRMTDLDRVHKMLEGGHSNVPQPRDTEKSKYYVPRNPFQTASYYPQVPLAILSSPTVFAQLDVETLFYVFYFLPGTYQQHLAAKELKRQSWRFHVKYLTWFQRHSEPQAITEEYEQGVYVYFDWEGSWCQRKKSDFRFEYRYLSEE